MNIYVIIFIIIIPFSIFFIAIYNDENFQQRIQLLKDEFNYNINRIRNNNNSIGTKQIYELNNGIGFGFGKEYFSCENPELELSDAQKCKLKNTAIGIKFHKFKMRRDYNVPELDDIKLNDYCSKEFLEGNFVTLINNFWNESRVKFYLREIIEEDEKENLIKYYSSTPEENSIFPSCKDIVSFEKNPIEFNGNIPEPLPTQTGSLLEEQDLGDVYSLFSFKNSPPKETTPLFPSLPEEYGKINYNEKGKMADVDINILKRLLAQENCFSNDKNKQIIRNIFFRMTNESLYEDDKDIHVYLLPYVEDEIAFIVEGRNKRPLIVVSMYYLECKKVKRNIEKTKTEKTCGLWMSKLLGNYNTLRNFEIQYNQIAKLDIDENPNNRCAAGIVDPEQIREAHDNLNKLRIEEKNIMDEVNRFENSNKNIEEINMRIQRNTSSVTLM